MGTEVLYISAAETRALVNLTAATQLVEQVCHWSTEGEEVWPPEPNIFRLRHTDPGMYVKVKMVALTALPIVGVRLNGYPQVAGQTVSSAENNTRYVFLIDPETARPLAIVDEHWTYNLRTCASGIVALRHLANPGTTTVGMLGAGTLATTCLEMIVRERPVREIRVTSRRPESREAFAAQMTEKLGIPVRPYASAQEVVEGSGIVMTCTSAKTHLVHAEWLAPGATICLLGQDELYPDGFRMVDKVIVSDAEVVKEATDFREVLQRGELTMEEVWSDLASVVTGAKPGRESATERIAIRASGLVSQDVAFSHYVYQEAVKRGIGVRLPVG